MRHYRDRSEQPGSAEICSGPLDVGRGCLGEKLNDCFSWDWLASRMYEHLSGAPECNGVAWDGVQDLPRGGASLRNPNHALEDTVWSDGRWGLRLAAAGCRLARRSG